MKLSISRSTLARTHSASLQMRLALARWHGGASAMPQNEWQSTVQCGFQEWLEAGGFSGMARASPQTKTAAKGRRSLASQRDSDEEFQFTLIRIHDAAE